MQQTKKRIKIKFVDWGTASWDGETLEINPILLKYPKLLKSTLRHELEHINNKNWFQDFVTDLKGFSDLSWEGLIFSFKHPKMCLQSLAPVWIDKKQGILNYNSFLIVLYFFTLLLFLFVIVV